MISFIIIGKNSLHLHNDIDHRFLSDTFQVDLLLLLLHVHHVLLLLRVHKSIRVHVHIHIHIHSIPYHSYFNQLSSRLHRRRSGKWQ